MQSSGSSLSLLLHHHHPPRLPSPPWRLSLSSHYSPFHFRRSSAPITAHKFDFGPRSFTDNDDADDFGDVDFDRTRRSKSRRRRTSKQRQRRWFDEREREPSMLDQVIDGLWLFKVLRPYGWFLPIVLLSILLASGPKAFLMAFSLPLGFSLLALAFEKLSAWLGGTSQPKRRRKPKSPFANAKPSSTEEEDQESEPLRRSQKRRYRSWAARNNGSVHKGSEFGGWDELIGEEEERDRLSRTDQKTDEQEKPEEEAVKSSMAVRERELPLPLKLLVSFFPFLGSWTSFLP